MRRERTGYPILTAEQTRAMDAAVSRSYGLPLAVLMENAGRAVADVVTELGAQRILVAVGSGNNGGDALVAARLLHLRGKGVTAVLTKPVEELDGLAALSARRYRDAGGCLAPAGTVPWDAADIIVDGLLGTGISGSVREPVATIIAGINAAGRRVVSIDVPSGVDSDASRAPETAVRATVTVTLGCYKPALVHYPAAAWAGEVCLADIGFPPPMYPEPGSLVLSADFVAAVLPVFQQDSHKGKRGTLLVLAGSRGMAGAATLASTSATMAGAGLVYLACPDALTPTFEVKLTDQVLKPVPDGGAGRYTPAALDAVLGTMKEADAVALGPGLGTADATGDFVAALLPKVDKPLLVDADGLNLVAARGLSVPHHTVLTPHPGEMARLLGKSIPEVQADRIASANEAVGKFGCAVVLKGAHTVIAAPGETPVVNMASHPVLATGGTGDLLSGVIGALMAQGLSPFEAALAGVRWHGTAGLLAASNRGSTLGADAIREFLPRAREVILTHHETEYLV